MSSKPQAPSDAEATPKAAAPTKQTLARITPLQQLRINPTQIRLSEGAKYAVTLQIGGAVLVGILGLLAWPFGLRAVSFAFAAGILLMILGLVTGRTTTLLRNTLARKRAQQRGQITLTNGILVIPTAGDPMQFNLRESHTLLRAWYRLKEDPSVTITSMLIAQDGQRAILYSNEPSHKDDAMDHGFPSEQNLPFIKKPNEDYLCIPLEGIYTLSRLIDDFLREHRED